MAASIGSTLQSSLKIIYSNIYGKSWQLFVFLVNVLKSVFIMGCRSSRGAITVSLSWFWKLNIQYLIAHLMNDKVSFLFVYLFIFLFICFIYLSVHLFLTLSNVKIVETNAHLQNYLLGFKQSGWWRLFPRNGLKEIMYWEVFKN